MPVSPPIKTSGRKKTYTILSKYGGGYLTNLDFNEDEKELFSMISELKPYDVMQIAINQNGTRMSVTIKNNEQKYKEFKITRKDET